MASQATEATGPVGYREPIRDLAQIRAIERMPYGEVVPVASMPGLIERAAALHPDRPALSYLERGTADEEARVTTYAAFARQVRAVAAGFRRMGLGAGEAVALMLPPMPETFVALFAAERAGVACPVNAMLAPDRIADILAKANARILVTLGPGEALNAWDRAVALRGAVPGLRVVAVGGAPEPWAGDFGELMAGAPDDAPPCPGGEALAAWFHTGGTTGSPKLVRHSHASQVHASWFGGLYFGIGPEDTVVNGFPLFHVAGSFVLAGSAFAAGANTLIPSRSGMRNRDFVRDYWRIVARHRVTLLSGGPTFISTLVGTEPDRAACAGVKALVGGGSSMPVGLVRRFEALTGIPVRPIYGMTEAVGLISVAPRLAPCDPGSAGWPLPFTQTAVFAQVPGSGPDLARRLPAGETGAICIRGPNVTAGYADPSAGAPGPDGWFATGDLGRIDAEGCLHVTGRAKDVIIRGGHNIDPAGIEEALARHPDVALCAAVGLPDAYAGELPMAFVTLREGAVADMQALMRFAAAQVPERAAAPVRIEALAALPLTTTGKILRPALRERAAELAFRDRLAAVLPEGALVGLDCRDLPEGRTVSLRLARSCDGADLRALIAERLSPFAVTLGLQAEGD